MHLVKLLSVSGFLYYIYNEVAFLALAEVVPTRSKCPPWLPIYHPLGSASARPLCLLSACLAALCGWALLE